MEALAAYAKLFEEVPGWRPYYLYLYDGGHIGWQVECHDERMCDGPAIALCRMAVVEQLIDAGYAVGHRPTVCYFVFPVNPPPGNPHAILCHGDSLDTALVAAARAMGEK